MSNIPRQSEFAILSDGRPMRSTRAGTASIIGRSAWARQIREDILRVAAFPANVLIAGPTGTGKELVARAIHAESPRADGPFVPVDCAAVSGDLFSSELFGHLEGAFTGASKATLGCFRAADGGTLLLDEIGELRPDAQAKLLRVIQERMVVPVGSHEPVAMDVRIVAATNRDLSEEVKAGCFREDLYHRLNVVSLHMTALRDRAEDIRPLAEHFLRELAAQSGSRPSRLTPDAVALLESHGWSGNVRELRNLLERATVFGRDKVIDGRFLAGLDHLRPETLPIVVPDAPLGLYGGDDAAADNGCPETFDDAEAAEDASGWPTLDELEREHIQRALLETGYNRTACAKLLGIDARRLARRIKKHRISVPESKPGRPRRRAA